MAAHSPERILLAGKVKRCLLERFDEYLFNRKSGFQLRTFEKKGDVAIRVIYRITGQAVARFSGKEKRNAKLRNLREFTEHLLTNGFALSEVFPSNGKASYVIRQPQLMKSRLASFDGVQMNSLLLADGQDENDLKNLYLVSSYWYGDEHPEMKLTSMHYGSELMDNYNAIELANYGYKVIGLLSDDMVKRISEWWSSKNSDVFSLKNLMHPVKDTRITFRQWVSNHMNKNFKRWKAGR